MKKKGFTLIELMLVITIILVLLGFIVPKFSSYQYKARETKALNAAKQIQTAAMASYGESEGKFINNKVKAAIDDFTSIKATSVSGGNDQTVSVSYKSDSKECTVTINASDNTYKLEYDGKEVGGQNKGENKDEEK